MINSMPDWNELNILRLKPAKMIQRIQTLWLTLASLVALATLRFAFYTGNKTDASLTKTFVELTAVNNFLLLILTVAVAVISLIVIFLYKDRKMQMRLTLLSLGISLLSIYLYFRETTKFTEGKLALTSVLTFFIPIFLVLAIRGIYKDDKLIKSADRLR